MQQLLSVHCNTVCSLQNESRIASLLSHEVDRQVVTRALQSQRGAPLTQLSQYWCCTAVGFYCDFVAQAAAYFLADSSEVQPSALAGTALVCAVLFCVCATKIAGRVRANERFGLEPRWGKGTMAGGVRHASYSISANCRYIVPAVPCIAVSVPRITTRQLGYGTARYPDKARMSSHDIRSMFISNHYDIANEEECSMQTTGFHKKLSANFPSLHAAAQSVHAVSQMHQCACNTCFCHSVHKVDK